MLRVQIVQTLFPNKNTAFTQNLLKHCPPPAMPGGGRPVRILPEWMEVKRMSDFSFAITDILQVSPQMKAALLQVA